MMETLQQVLKRMLREDLDRQAKAKADTNLNNPEKTDTNCDTMNDFCNSKDACKMLDCSPRTLSRFRSEGKLLEGIHYGRSPSRKVLYNVKLLNHLIACGGDINDPGHQRFIEIYLADRPENQPKQSGRKRAASLHVVAG